VTIYGNVWVSEVARGTLTKLTFGANNFLSAWSPDGQRLAFASDRTGQWNLFRMPADGSGAAEPLLKSDYPQLPNSFSPDGRLLAFTDFHPDTLADISLLPLAGERRPRPFLQTPFAEWGAVFSPDGRWIAYVSNESDSDQVYVRPFPGPGGKWQISTDEGREPVWAPDGRELFYRRHNGREVMAVSIKTEPEFTAGPPRVLFEGRYEEGELHVIQNYDLAPDGQRFVMIKRSEPDRGPTQLNVVLNWFEELNRRVPRPGN
jgi:Tol biopolymer transport system component